VSATQDGSQTGRRRRSRGLILLVVVIVVVLLAEAAVLTAVFVSPSAGAKLESVAASAERAWSGTEDQPGLRTRTARAARSAYEAWIVPLWKGPEPGPAEPEFTSCVDCHPDYASKRRFDVYMNHPIHAEIGVRCVTCHPENPHPSPPRPREAVCAECHPEVQSRDDCGFCHPPGSLPHFYLLGAPRTAAVRCDVCHPKGAFDLHATEPKVAPEDLTGANEATCLSCHENETCESCHEPAHPVGWLEVHGSGAGQGENTNCYTCHTGTWCSDRCHAVTTTAPFQPRPLPTPGVRP